MKKIIAITSLLAFSSFSQAGWLDAVKSVKGATDTVKGSTSATSMIPGADPKSMVTAAIKTQLGDNANKESIRGKFGEPSVPPFKNAAGDEIWQYGMAGMLKSLGSAAAMLNTVVKDMTQTVEFTFKGGADAMSNVAVVDATNASKPAETAPVDAAAPTTEAAAPATDAAPAAQ